MAPTSSRNVLSPLDVTIVSAFLPPLNVEGIPDTDLNVGHGNPLRGNRGGHRRRLERPLRGCRAGSQT